MEDTKNVKHLHYLYIILSIALGILLLALDQLTKIYIFSKQITTTGNVVDITILFNQGSLWGLFASQTSNIIFIILSILVFFLIIYLFLKTKTTIHKLFLAMLSAGILGNLIDRIRYQAVLDWINFHFWPVFNLADTYIVITAISLAIILIREEYLKKNIN